MREAWGINRIETAAADSFSVGQEVFVLVYEHGNTPVNPMVSVQKLQVKNISDNFVVTTYKGEGKLIGICHTSEEANRQLLSETDKVIEQVQKTLNALIELRLTALRASGGGLDESASALEIIDQISQGDIVPSPDQKK